MTRTESRDVQREAEAPRRLNHFDYFTEVEDLFIRRRGKTLLLSPLDWALIEGWKTKGVPLHVVLRGIERSFESFAKKPRRRSIKSLLYCEEEVEAQYAEWLESQIGKAAPAMDEKANGDRRTGMTRGDGAATNARASSETSAPPVQSDDVKASDDASLPFAPRAVYAYLIRSREALSELYKTHTGRTNAALFCETIERVIARLDELVFDWEQAALPSAEHLEASLVDLERLLDEALPTLFAPEAFAAERRLAIEQLEPYRRRMEPSTYHATLAHLLNKRLRDVVAVPRLSLFHL